MFEACKTVLMRDSGSLLAQLCGNQPPVSEEADGSFMFDRDWWLFRFILIFLRDGVLPDDRGLLAQLYKETTYWRLTEMQHKIEEEKLHLREPKTKDGKMSDEEKIPIALAGLAGISLPFILGLIALYSAK